MIFPTMTGRRLMLACALAAAVSSLPAWGQVSLSIDIGTPPPPPRVVEVPPPRPGFFWAPGFWRWDGRRHVWIEPHWVAERPGYRWVPEHWDARGGRYHFEPGRWEQARVEPRHEEHFRREERRDRDERRDER